METDQVAAPLPPVKVLMKKVQERLARSPLVELVPFKPFQHGRAWTILASLYFEDGGKQMLELFQKSGEPLLPLTEFILQQAQDAEAKSPPSLATRRSLRDEFRAAYSEHWNSQGVDMVLAPVTPGTAPQLETSKYWGYTAIWNLLDYPAVSFPAATLVGGLQQEDLEEVKYAVGGEGEEVLFAHYHVADAAGQPLGLQIVGKRWQDGEVIAALATVEEALMRK